MKRLLLVLTALLACGLIAAGCGGDDDDDGGDDSPATTESAPTDTSGDIGDEDVDSVDEAVQACKDSVEANSSQLSEDLRGDLEDLCEQAASGDEDEIREATLEACRRVVEETIPDAAARETALDACEGSVP